VTPDPAARARATDPSSLRRWEMWVRTVMSPALVAALPVRAERTTFPRRSLHRLRIVGARDVPSVLEQLAGCGVEVLEIRAVDRSA